MEWRLGCWAPRSFYRGTIFLVKVLKFNYYIDFLHRLANIRSHIWIYFIFASAVNMHKLWHGKVPAPFDGVATPAFVVDRVCSKAGSEENPRYSDYAAIRLFGRYPMRTLIA
jgi:hypothetical protein